MAIIDYASLQTAIGDWMFGRTDLAAYYDQFIANAEVRFNYGVDESAPYPSQPIRVRDMISTDDLTLVDGEAALPDTFIETYRATAKTDPRTKLEYVSADWLDANYPTAIAGCPIYYTIVGSNLVVRPVTSSDVELKFYEKIESLSGTATTNWLITKAPNVYLYAALLEANLFLGRQQRATTFYGMMMGAIGGLMRTDKRASAGTQPARRAASAVA